VPGEAGVFVEVEVAAVPVDESPEPAEAIAATADDEEAVDE